MIAEKLLGCALRACAKPMPLDPRNTLFLAFAQCPDGGAPEAIIGQLLAGHADGLEHGELFSACVARFPALYDRKLTALIRVGEETNRLPEMLRRQGEALTEELEFRIKRMGALLEPALIMLVGLLVAVILISMYMPMFRLGGIMG